MQKRKLKIPYSGGFGVEALEVPGPFASMNEVKIANQRIDHHYFDRSTVRFFRSRPARNTILGRFFIDLIQFEPSTGDPFPRTYKIVCVTDRGECESLVIPPQGWNGEPRKSSDPDDSWEKEEFKSAAAAKAALKYLLTRLPEVEPPEVKQPPRYEFQMWSNYGAGWEHELSEDTLEAIRERLKEYRENAPQYRYRYVRVKVEEVAHEKTA